MGAPRGPIHTDFGEDCSVSRLLVSSMMLGERVGELSMLRLCSNRDLRRSAKTCQQKWRDRLIYKAKYNRYKCRTPFKVVATETLNPDRFSH